jgi:hypothetical protein
MLRKLRIMRHYPVANVQEWFRRFRLQSREKYGQVRVPAGPEPIQPICGQTLVDKHEPYTLAVFLQLKGNV